MPRGGNNAVTTQPGANLNNYPNEWSSGLCDCCQDMKTCLFAFICFHCYMCCLARDAGECMCTPVFCPTTLVQLRTKLRAHYKIDGAVWKDALVSQCFPFCAALQLSNELRAHGDAY